MNHTSVCLDSAPQRQAPRARAAPRFRDLSGTRDWRPAQPAGWLRPFQQFPHLLPNMRAPLDQRDCADGPNAGFGPLATAKRGPKKALRGAWGLGTGSRQAECNSRGSWAAAAGRSPKGRSSTMPCLLLPRRTTGRPLIPIIPREGWAIFRWNCMIQMGLTGLMVNPRRRLAARAGSNCPTGRDWPCG